MRNSCNNNTFESFSPTPSTTFRSQGLKSDTTATGSMNSIPGEMESGPSNDELFQILECPVCTEYPIPPIYSCSKGHFTCNDCIKLLSACTVCQSQFTDVRNYALESIVERTKFTCKFASFGCHEKVFGADYAKHVDQCLFRKIPCEVCGDTFTESSFLQHLVLDHNAQSKVIFSGQKFAENVIQVDDGAETLFPLVCLMDETSQEKVFILHTMKYKSFICWWIKGLTKEENQFAKLTLTKVPVVDNEDEFIRNECPKIQWNLPIQTIHSSLEDIRESTNCAVLPLIHLASFASDGNGIRWKIHFEIIKKESVANVHNPISNPTTNAQSNAQSNASIPAILFLTIAIIGIGGLCATCWTGPDKIARPHETEYHGYRGFYHKTNPGENNAGQNREMHEDCSPSSDDERLIGYRGFYHNRNKMNNEVDIHPFWRFLRSSFIALMGDKGSKYPSRVKQEFKHYKVDEQDDYLTIMMSHIFFILFCVFCTIVILVLLTMYKSWLSRDPVLQETERREAFRSSTRRR